MNELKQGGVLPGTNRDDSPVVLTTETYDGHYHAELFHDIALALATLKQQKEGKEIDLTYEIENGFMTTDGVLRRVVSLDQALSLDGKVVWRVGQRCFLPETFGKMDWDNYYTTQAEAKALYDERTNLYRQMAEGNKRIRIEEDEDQMTVFLKGKPAVYLDVLARPIGEMDQVGTVLLTSYL